MTDSLPPAATALLSALSDEEKNVLLLGKLHRVTAKAKYIEKKGWNQAQRYKFVREADLVEKMAEFFREENLLLTMSCSQADVHEHATKLGRSAITTIKLAIVIWDIDTGANLPFSWIGQGDDPGDKGIYKAYTGALKYFFLRNFLIPSGDDPEADSSTDERDIACLTAPAGPSTSATTSKNGNTSPSSGPSSTPSPAPSQSQSPSKSNGAAGPKLREWIDKTAKSKIPENPVHLHQKVAEFAKDAGFDIGQMDKWSSEECKRTSQFVIECVKAYEGEVVQ